MPRWSRLHDKKSRKFNKLEYLAITMVYARTNRAWHRAARPCPRANTAFAK